jgi:hypothetical protein
VSHGTVSTRGVLAGLQRAVRDARTMTLAVRRPFRPVFKRPVMV